jgi:gluconate 2-dehydrogenase gamma chain
MTGEVAMAEDTIARRKFLLGAGIAGTAVAAGITSNAEAQTTPATAAAPVPANEPVTYLTLSALEAAFVSAVADTMIPADELSPSGTDCGVVVFIGSLPAALVAAPSSIAQGRSAKASPSTAISFH